MFFPNPFLHEERRNTKITKQSSYFVFSGYLRVFVICRRAPEHRR